MAVPLSPVHVPASKSSLQGALFWWHIPLLGPLCPESPPHSPSLSPCSAPVYLQNGRPSAILVLVPWLYTVAGSWLTASMSAFCCSSSLALSCCTLPSSELGCCTLLLMTYAALAVPAHIEDRPWALNNFTGLPALSIWLICSAGLSPLLQRTCQSQYPDSSLSLLLSLGIEKGPTKNY